MQMLLSKFAVATTNHASSAVTAASVVFTAGIKMRRRTLSSSFSSLSSSVTLKQQQHQERQSQQPLPMKGIFPIVVTPFHPQHHDNDDNDESLDLESFQRSIQFLFRSGACAGVTIAGVLGESNRLLDSEREQLIQVARETIQQEQQEQQRKQQQQQQQQQQLYTTNDTVSTIQTNDFCLCVGTSYSGTAATVALSQMAKDLGADAVMIAPSKDAMNTAQPSDDDIFKLYEKVSDACGPNLSIVLQDHPSSTGVHMSIDLLTRIVSNVPTVHCIKLESLPTTQRLVALQQQYYEQSNTLLDKHCTILTGLGALYAGYDLEPPQAPPPPPQQHQQSKHLVVSGFMTGFAFPEILHAMYVSAVQRQDYHQAYAIYQKFLPLIVLEQQPGVGLAIRKEIYRLRGLIRSSHVRHPGKNLSKIMSDILHKELNRTFGNAGAAAASGDGLFVDWTKPLSMEMILQLVNETTK